MGLDTTHDCWHGPYSMFHRWRSELHYLLTGDHLGRGGYDASMNEKPGAMPWPYAGDAPLPLGPNLEPCRDRLEVMRVLMAHSDCDGEITPDACGPLADALQILVDHKMPQRAVYDMMRPATERFIAGLRRAAEAGEAVRFG